MDLGQPAFLVEIDGKRPIEFESMATQDVPGSGSGLGGPSTTPDKKLAKLRKRHLLHPQLAPPPTQFRLIEQYYKQRLWLPDYGLAFGRHAIPHSAPGLLPAPQPVRWSTPHKATSILAHVHTIPVSPTSDSDRRPTDCPKCPPRSSSVMCTFPDQYPGLIYLPSYLCEHQQANLVTDCLTNGLKKPNLTNLDAHWQVPSEAGIYELYRDWLKSSQAKPDQQLQDPLVEQDHTRFVLQPRPAPDDAPDQDTQQAPHSTHSRRQRVDFEPITAENFLVARNEKPKQDPVLSKTTKPIHVSEAWMGGKIRWSTIGWQYHWTTKTYHFDRAPTPISELVRGTCTELINRVIPWSLIEGEQAGSMDRCGTGAGEEEGWKRAYKPEAGVINFYQYRDSLTAHIDHSEVSTDSPLVSLSIGQACVFLISPSREQEPVAIKLESGDALVMAGQSRRYFHGVPRIIEDSLPAWMIDGTETKDLDWIHWFRNGGRININVRQVFA